MSSNLVYLKILLHRYLSTGISRLQPASHLIRTVYTHSKILHSNHSGVTFRMWFHPLSSEDHNLIQGPLALTVKHSNINFHKRSSTGKPLIPSKVMTIHTCDDDETAPKARWLLVEYTGVCSCAPHTGQLKTLRSE